MSEKKVTKVGIVGRIMVALGLGDEGRIGKFFAKEVKKCDNAVKQLKHNLAGELSQFKIEKEKLEDKLEDAREAVVDAYENVKPEDVSNNAKMDEFAEDYWNGVEITEGAVESIESSLENLTTRFDEGGTYYGEDVISFQGKKTLKEQIAKYESRVEKILN